MVPFKPGSKVIATLEGGNRVMATLPPGAYLIFTPETRTLEVRGHGKHGDCLAVFTGVREARRPELEIENVITP